MIELKRCILIKCDCSACKYYDNEFCNLERKGTSADDWCLYWDAPRGEESDVGNLGTDYPSDI